MSDEPMSDITPDDIDRVFEYLKSRANAKSNQLVYFSDIERELGKEVYSSQWHLLLDPIYEEVKIRQGKPDLTCIVVFKSGDKQGYPPYFSDGGPVRSRPFNPNNLAQLTRWTKEVARVFLTPW
jgi:hypothetical protein